MKYENRYLEEIKPLPKQPRIFNDYEDEGLTPAQAICLAVIMCSIFWLTVFGYCIGGL